jgi:two-component system cell cycle sensor histidine kinase/response regulator CckA
MSDKTTRILLIEDNPGDARFIRKVLADAMPADPSAPAFDLTCARRLSSGLKRLAKGRFDAILLDLSLPDTLGLDALVKTHAQASGLPIIVLSDPGNKEMALEAVQKGAQDYLIKGEVSGSLLVRVIRYAIEHKRAKEALRESEERVRNLSELISDFAYTARVEPDGSFVVERTTSAFTRITGFTTEEWAHGGWQTLFHPEDLPAVTRFGERLLSGEPDASDLRIITKSGKVRWIRNYSRPVWDERQARVVRIIGAFQDITERKQTEEALAQERNLLRTLIDNLPDAVYVKDMAGRKTLANRADLRNMQVKSEADALGKTDFDIYPEELATQFHANDQIVLQTGQAILDHEEMIGELDGQQCWILTSKLPLRDTTGRIIGLVGIGHDITERGQAQEALRESEERFRTLVETSSDWIWEVNEHGVYTYSSPKVKDLLGYEPAEIVGRTPFDFMLPEEAERVRAQTAETSQARRAFVRLENVNRHKDGRMVVLETSGVPIFDVNGVFRGYRGIGRDITERERVKEALVRINKAVESSSDAIGMSDAQGHHFYHNKAFTELFEYTPGELEAAGGGPAAYADQDVAREVFDTIMSGGAWSGEVEMVSKSGRRFPVLLRADAIKDESEKTIGLVGVHTDITERKRAEEALTRERNLLRVLIDNLPEAISLKDLAGRIILSNPVDQRYLGVATEDEVLGKTDFDMYAEEDAASYSAADELVIRTGKPLLNEEALFVDANGRQYDTLFSKLPLRNQAGQIIGVLTVLRDITERKRREEALLESEQKYRFITEKMTETVWLMDMDLKPTFISPSVTRTLGYTLEEIQALPMDKLLTQESFESATKTIAQELGPERLVPRSYERSVTVELEFCRKDGSTLWIESTITLLRDLEGRPTSLMGVGRDTTERKRAEKERERLLAQVQEQAQRVQQIVDTVPEGVVLLDTDHRAVLANPIGKRNLDTLAGAQVGDILTHLGRRPLSKLLTSPPKGLWHEVAAGNRSFEVIARPIEDGPVPQGWVLVVRDVTQQREMERRIQQQERLVAVGQLAAGIAHDFNNIMAVITLYAGMSLRTPGLPGKVYEHFETINQQAKRASALIQQILDFSRRAVLERGPIDMLVFLKEQIELLRRTLPESIKIDMSYGEDECVIRADPTRMQQAIVNLATNARDAMPEGGQLHLGLERVRIEDRDSAPLPEMGIGDWVRVTVTDTGAGIAPHAMEHIFEPFFTTKSPAEGTGLGLAQVYGIIRQHDGYIDVSTKVGEGTTFTLYLPALLTQRGRTSPPRPQPLIAGQGQTILVVEDEAATRKALADSLEPLGYQTLEAANGQEALTVFEQREGQIDLVLSDIVMPEMGGKALLRKLRQQYPDVKVVLMSGHPLEETEIEALRADGLADWLAKPPSLEQLARVVGQALARVTQETGTVAG